MRSGRDVTNEEVERYVKERYEDPALREAAQRDDGGGAQAGAPLPPCARPRLNRKLCQGGGPARGRRRAGAPSAGPLLCAVTGMGPLAVQGCPQWRRRRCAASRRASRWVRAESAPWALRCLPAAGRGRAARRRGRAAGAAAAAHRPQALAGAHQARRGARGRAVPAAEGRRPGAARHAAADQVGLHAGPPEGAQFQPTQKTDSMPNYLDQAVINVKPCLEVRESRGAPRRQPRLCRPMLDCVLHHANRNLMLLYLHGRV